jgi:regulation of enolase protein 1 (concanavalin A-like superfamily)
MKETIAQFLKVKDFPFFIKDKNNKEIYIENSNGFWYKNEYDQNGRLIYIEDSNGFWSKSEYDQDGKLIYYENSDGNITDKRPKIIELSLQEVADKLGLNVENIRIKD